MRKEVGVEQNMMVCGAFASAALRRTRGKGNSRNRESARARKSGTRQYVAAPR
jgi:hypothetical protein